MSAMFQPKEPPEKLWELLRRNDRFRRWVSGFQEIDRRCQPANPGSAPRSMGRGLRLLANLNAHNSFAAIALRWLVPQPIFEVREIALSSDGKTVEAIRLGLGLTPNLTDSNWRWFRKGRGPQGSVESRANADGRPIRWGPDIHQRTTKDRRIAQLSFNEIDEWRAYFARRQFTVDTPWPETPPGFQRAFSNLWRMETGEGTTAFETGFFAEWNLSDLVLRARQQIEAANRCILDLVSDLDRIRRGQPETICPPLPTPGGNTVRQIPRFSFNATKTETARMIMFPELARRRVFALRPPITRKQAHAAFAGVANQIAGELPDDHDLLGTPAFWADFIAVEAIQTEGALNLGKAITRHLRQSRGNLSFLQRETGLSALTLKRWFGDWELHAPGPKATRRERAEFANVRSVISPVLSRLNANNRTTIKDRVEFLCQLSRATFPQLNWGVLTSQPPHKRTNRK